jgi:hypothetical protein
MDFDSDLTEKNLDEIFDALTYNGFSIDDVRKNVIVESDGSFRTIEEVRNFIIVSLISLAKAGNNLSKLTSKVKDKQVGLEVKKKIKEFGIKVKAKDPGTITLPRMAIAFLPTYILIRKKFKEHLQRQTASTLNIVYCDISLCGVEEIWNKTGYQDFYHSFSKLIGKKKKKDDDDDDDDSDDDDSDSEDDEPAKKKRKKNNSKAEKKKDGKQKKKNMGWVNIAQAGFAADLQSIKDYTVKVVKSKKTKITMDMIRDSIDGMVKTIGYEINDKGAISVKAVQENKGNEAGEDGTDMQIEEVSEFPNNI